ncbi:MAG: hypothetical protein JRF53_00425 [Deltaproteobacteria bacterium]|nr:hypothetical protein [Deltaproteobacteria bacterium]
MFKRIKLYKFIQGEKNRNRAALRCLSLIGFSLPAVRDMLFKGNKIKLNALAEDHGIVSSTLYNTIKGIRHSSNAQQISAGALGLDVKELYPEQ